MKIFFALAFSLVLVVSSLSNTQAQVNLLNGLLGDYSFSGNANDASSNTNNGTVSGATLTTDRFGNTNSAYSFDGVNDYISIPHTDFLNSNYSFSLWARLTTLPSSGNSYALLSIGGSGGDQQIAVTNNYNAWTGWSLIGYNTGGSVQSPRVNALPSLNTWYHIVGIRDNSNLYLYINGQLIDQYTTGGVAFYSNSPQAHIGARTSIQYFNGSIDDVKIYNRVLNECEIIALANEGNVSSLIGDYSFSGNANDASSNTNNGTVSGATLTTDRFGNTNSAYSFDGVNDYISLPHADFLNSNYSFSLWARLTTLPSSGNSYALLSIGGPGGDQQIAVTNNYNGWTGWSLIGYNTGGSVQNPRVNALPSLNTWYHIVGIRDNSNLYLYINGQLIDQYTTGGVAFYSNSPQAHIGARTSIQYFNGSIDDVKIYNRALASCEVEDLFDSEVMSAINTPAELINISIYPNPLNGKNMLTIESDEVLNGHVVLLNYLGEEIYKGGIENRITQLNFGTLVEGIYIFKIKSDKGELSRKIVIN